jgi:hypothetical protein
MDELELKLVFIYNADSGPISLIKDFFHKVLKPSTYECNLCAVSFGNFSMKKEWKNYIDKLAVPTEFLHRDQFLRQYGINDAKFPSAYIRRDSKLELFISQDEMNELQSVEELIRIVHEKLREMNVIISIIH